MWTCNTSFNTAWAVWWPWRARDTQHALTGRLCLSRTIYLGLFSGPRISLSGSLNISIQLLKRSPFHLKPLIFRDCFPGSQNAFRGPWLGVWLPFGLMFTGLTRLIQNVVRWFQTTSRLLHAAPVMLFLWFLPFDDNKTRSHSKCSPLMDGPLPALLSSWPELHPACHGVDNCLLNSGGRPHTHSRQPRASSEAQVLGHVALHWAGLVCDFRLEPQRAEVPVPVAAVFPNPADLAFCGRVGRWTRAVRRPRGPWSADVEEEGPETGGLAREPGHGRETPRLTHTRVHTHVPTRSHAA